MFCALLNNKCNRKVDIFLFASVHGMHNTNSAENLPPNKILKKKFNNFEKNERQLVC